MKTAMKAANAMEQGHIQPMAALIYDTDGTNKVIVKDAKEMLISAAKALTPLQQYWQGGQRFWYKSSRITRRVTEHLQVLHIWHAELMSRELCTP